jgi:protoheme IX farnesyltransferase
MGLAESRRAKCFAQLHCTLPGESQNAEHFGEGKRSIVSEKSMQKQSIIKDYLTLCKLRVNALILLTAIVGMYLAIPGGFFMRTFTYSWYSFVLAILGIGLLACSAASINHYVDAAIDAKMQRTKKRPMVVGSISGKQTLIFAFIIGLIGFVLLYAFINPLCAWLTFFTLIGYAVIYTCFLKHATPQNIVWGGLAGAMPPLLGWVAVRDSIALEPILLVLIIFVWTPPHFWALAINRKDDYAKANVPMLPVTHGIPHTKLQVVIYTWALAIVSLLPYVFKTSGIIYLIPALLLNARFIYMAHKLRRDPNNSNDMQVFKYSITYLMLLFVVLMLDHALSYHLLQLCHADLCLDLVR